MGNLGMYQWMTFVSKKVGGPKNFMLLVALGGYATLRTAEWAGKTAFKAIKGKDMDGRIYTVKSSYAIGGDDKGCCEFVAGDQYRILETDGDAVLIEKIGDSNNPYFADKRLLEEITE